MSKVIAGLILLLLMTPGSASPDAKSRILVLGTRSDMLNDLQDRIFREELLRRFHDKGHAVVPVMEMEVYFRGEGYRRPERINRTELRRYSSLFQDASVVAVEISVRDESGTGTAMEEGKEYRCRVYLYDSADNRFHESEILVTGKETLYRFFTELSKRVTEEIERFLDRRPAAGLLNYSSLKNLATRNSDFIGSRSNF